MIDNSLKYLPTKNKHQPKLKKNWRLNRLLPSVILVELLLLCYFWPKITSPQPNICPTLNAHPNWYQQVLLSHQRWGVPIATELAIIDHESHFNPMAKTRNKSINGVAIPGTHITSASGFTQALNGTWRLYQLKTHHWHARRSSFRDSADFVGWFLNRAHTMDHISLNNTKSLYLAYHEGINGYHHKSYQHKPSLLPIADKVTKLAKLFKHQLHHCPASQLH